MKKFINDNIDADILHISGHGYYDRKRNIAGLMVGNEFWMADENDYRVPAVVILSACHVSPRGSGTVNIADMFVRAGAEAVLGTFIPINAKRNMIFINRFYTYMEEFIENVKILISTLGYKVLLPAPQATDDTIYLYCKGSGASAKGFVSAGGFTVLKDSIVSDHIVPSLETRGKTYYNLRNKLEVDGVISERKFVRNYEFSAPSAASAVILGHTSNGNMDWKTAGGVRLKDL